MDLLLYNLPHNGCVMAEPWWVCTALFLAHTVLEALGALGAMHPKIETMPPAVKAMATRIVLPVRAMATRIVLPVRAMATRIVLPAVRAMATPII
jgi:hypothetical protein